MVCWNLNVQLRGQRVNMTLSHICCCFILEGQGRKWQNADKNWSTRDIWPPMGVTLLYSQKTDNSLVFAAILCEKICQWDGYRMSVTTILVTRQVPFWFCIRCIFMEKHCLIISINCAEKARCTDWKWSKGRLTVSLQRKGVLKMNLKTSCLVRFHIGHFISNENLLKSLEQSPGSFHCKEDS